MVKTLAGVYETINEASMAAIDAGLAYEAAKNNLNALIEESKSVLVNDTRRRLKELFDGAPAVISVCASSNGALPTKNDYPYKYGCYIMPARVTGEATVDGMYVKLEPHEIKYIMVPTWRNQNYPIIASRNVCCENPVFDNASFAYRFLPKGKYTKSRYIPCYTFDTIRDIMTYSNYAYECKCNEAIHEFTEHAVNCDYLSIIYRDGKNLVQFVAMDKKHTYSLYLDKNADNVYSFNYSHGSSVDGCYINGCDPEESGSMVKFGKLLKMAMNVNNATFKDTLKQAKKWFNHYAGKRG